MEVGQEITIRGPYGNGFPVESAFKGKDLLFVAGGIGLAPLRSVINYVRAHRERTTARSTLSTVREAPTTLWIARGDNRRMDERARL